MSPWIRFIDLDGRDRKPQGRPRQYLWLTTGDVIEEFSCWPAERLPQRCALCRRTLYTIGGEACVILWYGALLFYCYHHTTEIPALWENGKQFARETQDAIRRAYPVFDMSAAPGEEWKS